MAVHKVDCPDERRDIILAFHAITGCDSTSQFAGISEKAAWKIFCSVPHLLSLLGIAHSPNAQVMSKAKELCANCIILQQTRRKSTPLDVLSFQSKERQTRTYATNTGCLTSIHSQGSLSGSCMEKCESVKSRYPQSNNMRMALGTKQIDAPTNDPRRTLSRVCRYNNMCMFT